MSNRFPQKSAVLLVIAAGACAGEVPPVEVSGGCADVYQAQVCTFATTKGDSLIEAGATVPIAAIENAPHEQPMVWPPAPAAAMDMPAPATANGGFKQLTVFWEHGGHPPGAFMTPHFDFHFYTVSAAERMAMDCQDLTKPAALPAAYGLPDIPLPPEMVPMMGGVPALIGLCVPTMGMHALLTSEIERTDAFHGSMVVGYYGGKPVFLEPMLSKAMLMQKRSFDLPVPTVPGMTGMQPTMFRAQYDSTQQAYRFTFSAFKPAS
jgi:hypothetical protein